MKKYIITKKDGSTCGMKTSDAQVFNEWKSACINANVWGKPEREIVEFSESYDEADVLSRRSESVGEGVINYVTLKAEYVITEEDITESYEAEQQLISDLKDGEACERACRQVKQLVAGYNRRRSLTSEQVTSFVQTFATILQWLDALRPDTSKALIQAVNVDGVIVTQELKDNALLIFTRNGF